MKAWNDDRLSTEYSKLVTNMAVGIPDHCHAEYSFQRAGTTALVPFSGGGFPGHVPFDALVVLDISAVDRVVPKRKYDMK